MSEVPRFPIRSDSLHPANVGATLLMFPTRANGLTQAEVADISALLPDLAGTWTLQTRTDQSGAVSVGLVPDWWPTQALRTIHRRGHRVVFQNFERTQHVSVIGNDGRGVLQRGQPEEWEFATLPAALAFIREKHRNRLREHLAAKRKAAAALRKATKARTAHRVMEMLEVL